VKAQRTLQTVKMAFSAKQNAAEKQLHGLPCNLVVELLSNTRFGDGYSDQYVESKNVKVKSDYFIVRPKVDQRAGLLSLPHLGIFAIYTR